ncbi:MAG: ATP-binding cassette domain-containing protein [Oscillospiraceae bacterium]
MGPNGAGKSTTIRTLMGLMPSTGGSASIFDLDCHSKASVIARDVGYLPSENSYYENMKVRELLQYTAICVRHGLQDKDEGACRQAQSGFVPQDSRPFSGQQEKGGIVSAIMTSPKLIIMDEPTSG